MQYILLYQQSMYSLPSLKLHTCCLSLHNTTSYFHKTLRKKTKVSRHTEKAFMGITSPSANVLGITTEKVSRTVHVYHMMQVLKVIITSCDATDEIT